MALGFLRVSYARCPAPPHETIFHSLRCRGSARFVPRTPCRQWRPFISTVRQLTVKTQKPALRQLNSKPQTPARPLQASKGSQAGYESFSESLARRSSPTVLYEAPSPYLYMTGCYVLATACFAYAGFNFESTYLHPPEQIGYWIPIAVGGVCVAMAFFGVWSIFGVSSLCSGAFKADVVHRHTELYAQ